MTAQCQPSESPALGATPTRTAASDSQKGKSIARTPGALRQGAAVEAAKRADCGTPAEGAPRPEGGTIKSRTASRA
eukprot:14344685-Alexandrium_andersonii.AAC.1